MSGRAAGITGILLAVSAVIGAVALLIWSVSALVGVLR